MVNEHPFLSVNCTLLRSLYAYIFIRLRAKDYRRRSITAILYLNEADWDASPDVDGGSLKCYIQADSDDVTGITATRVDKVCPTGGTLVIFDSRYLLHEVEPSHRDRLALTLWVVGDRNEAIHL